MKEKNFLKSLEKNHRVFLDTMCFIYYFEDSKKYASLCEKIFQYLLEKRIIAFTSLISYSEILIEPKKSKNHHLESFYREIFQNFPGLQITDYNWWVAELSAEIRVKYSIKLPDAINISSAIISEADVFITNDQKLTPIKEIPVLVLKDYL